MRRPSPSTTQVLGPLSRGTSLLSTNTEHVLCASGGAGTHVGHLGTLQGFCFYGKFPVGQ